MFGRSLSNVRPSAIVHWPTRIWLLGTIGQVGNGRFSSIFSSTSMRAWSVATSRAGVRTPSGIRTRIEDGLLTKLKALETI